MTTLNVTKRIVFFVSCLLTFKCLAAPVTELLPKGISSPTFSSGLIEGLNQRYTGDGSLMELGDYKSVLIDSTTLSKMDSRAKELIQALNRFGSQGLGDNFTLGVLRVETSPSIKYFAPVYAHGFTDKWTLAVGVPVITYENKFKLKQTDSNIDFYRSQLSGLSGELDQALMTEITAAASDVLKAKGFKSLESKNETFVGDLQLASIYELARQNDLTLFLQNQLSLPTGPKYDSDDLLALNTFGRTSLESGLTLKATINPSVDLIPYLSHTVNVPNQVTMRVPKNEEDFFPDESQKQTVTRKVGDSTKFGAAIGINFSDSFSLVSSYETLSKDEDMISGGNSGRVDLLTKESNSKATYVSNQLSYSTVKSYFKKTSAIPLIAAYSISDTIAGKNIERRLQHDIKLMLFF